MTGPANLQNFRCQCAEAAPLVEVARLLPVAATGRLDSHAMDALLRMVLADLRVEPLHQLAWHFPERAPDWRALHALNAARVAMFIGVRRGLSDEEVLGAGRTGLLYDLGMWRPEPATISAQPAPLDERAMEVLSRHPGEGANWLAAAGADETTVRVAREHHERPDGGGYPHSLTRNRLHEPSLLFQLIDSFLGQIEPRAFRPARSPVDAMARLLIQSQRGHYDMPAYRAFASALGLFPVGSVLKLSSGEWALCAGVGDDLKRPPVLLLTDGAGELRARPVLLRLADAPGVEVADGVASEGRPPAAT